MTYFRIYRSGAIRTLINLDNDEDSNIKVETEY